MSLNVRPRFLVLFRISFDALIFIFSTIIINAFFNYDMDNKFLFLILWLFVSYISGKYSDNYNKFDNLRVFDAISYLFLIFSFLIAFFNFQEFKLYLLVIFICNLLFLFYFLSKKQGKLKLKKHVLVCSKVIFDDIHSIIKKTYNDKSQILELYNPNNKVYLEQFDVLVFDEKLHFF